MSLTAGEARVLLDAVRPRWAGARNGEDGKVVERWDDSDLREDLDRLIDTLIDLFKYLDDGCPVCADAYDDGLRT